MENKNELIKAGQIAPATTQEVDLFQMIGQAASDENFDADKMQALINMKMQMDGMDAKKSFNRALVEFKKNPPRIIKNAKGHTNSYATIDSVCRQLDQPLNEIGLAFRWSIESIENRVKVTCILSHVDGHSEESSMEDVGETSGTKNAIQSKGSTITYLKRYTLLAALGLAEQGEDTDGITEAAKQGIGPEHIKQIEDLIEETGSDLIKFCQYMKVGALHELSISKYGVAINTLNTKKVNMNNENS